LDENASTLDEIKEAYTIIESAIVLIEDVDDILVEKIIKIKN